MQIQCKHTNKYTNTMWKYKQIYKYNVEIQTNIKYNLEIQTNIQIQCRNTNKCKNTM